MRAMRGSWLLALAVIGLGACSTHDTAKRERLLDTPAARRLVGTWNVSFEMNAHAAPPDAPAARVRVTGVIAFAPDHHGLTATTELNGITHEGAYDLDFRPFGWSTREADAPAVAVARVVSTAGASPSDTGRDSLYIVLSPGTQRFAVRMSGMLATDGATGIWSARSFSAGGGTGRFVMQRRAPAP